MAGQPGMNDGKRSPGWRTQATLWGASGLIVLAALFLATRHAGAEHPRARPDAATRPVYSAAHFAGEPRVSEIYGEAAQVPAVLDGLYCYCRCSKHSGHYSLLDCFATHHAAYCDICLSEAAMAFRMTKAGRTLGEIRHAIDELYGG